MAIDSARAARRTDESFTIMTETGADVCPGSYNLDSATSIRGGGHQASYPFNSLQERVLNPNISTSGTTPGPGSYIGQVVVSPHRAEPAFGEASTMSGTSFRSKSARIGPTAPGSTVFSTSTILKNPGPGEYQVASEWGREGPKQLVGALRPVAEVASRDRTAPSIPPSRLFPGQLADVSLGQARYRGDRADMAGPGDYDIPALVAFDQLGRLGPRFGGGAARAWRPGEPPGGLAPDGEPGPGSYEIQALGRSARLLQPDPNFTSGTALAHQKEVAADRIGPGPGQYSTQGQLEKSLKQAQERGAQVDNRFSSHSARVGWSRDISQPYMDPWNASHVPGPGSYGEPAASAIASPRRSGSDKEKLMNGGKKKKKLHGVHHPAVLLSLAEQQAPMHAFHTTDDRPCMKPGAQTTPSPAQYEIDRARGTSMEARLRERGKVGRKGVFGTCQDRFQGSSLLSPHVETAGVAWADPGSFAEETMGPMSSLQSKVPRFEAPAGPREPRAKALGVTDTPAPGAYDPDRAPSYSSPFRQPKQDHISFGSSDTRFTGAAANFGNLPRVGADPGQYDPNYDSVKSRVMGGGQHVSSRRAPTVGCTTESVGPGSYGDPVGGTSSLMKKSHNVTHEPKSARASTGTRR